MGNVIAPPSVLPTAPARARDRGINVRKWARRLLMLGAFGFLVRTTLVNLPTIEESGEQLLTRNSGLIALALGLEVVWTLCLANFYRSALRARDGSMNRVQALRVSMGVLAALAFGP